MENSNEGWRELLSLLTIMATKTANGKRVAKEKNISYL